jgi:hypothetical protein
LGGGGGLAYGGRQHGGDNIQHSCDDILVAVVGTGTWCVAADVAGAVYCELAAQQTKLQSTVMLASGICADKVALLA